jgi:hypothetical protein
MQKVALMQKVVILAGLLASLAVYYGHPFLMAGLWLARLPRQKPVSPPWRGVMSWLSLSLASAAFVAWRFVWANMGNMDPVTIKYERLGFYAFLAFTSGALVTALLAKGKWRVWTATAALIIPVQYLIWFGSVVMRQHSGS